MTPERWHRVKEVFSQASQLDTSSRRAYLEQACADDAELRSEVASLLSAHSTREAFIDRPAGDYLPCSEPEAVAEDFSGRRLGAYELTVCLGRGGMGEVWRARRADAQYQKEVAIKLVRVGFDSAFVLQRFKAERQILATLEHPNIAHLIDGGVTEQGQPYLVMELVDGRPIDEYCEAHDLPIAARLRLFREVCTAVSYAHQHLVVHRDLKPGNILVTPDGAIKLLDFGIAKLLQPAPDARAPAEATRTVMRALTPAFSSPEQVLGLNITTASDVYSLGVVLFHLLAGRGPYRTRLASTRDAIQDVCETEPLKPSAAAAQFRDKTRSLPDRELDDITLKALRKEPERRYSSVEQFSEDLRRYLAGLPVIARGDQLSYRAGKFLRRHRVQVAAGALVAVALLAGIVAATREARIAERQRARAERHFASVRQLANTFMFQVQDAIRDLPGATAARELLARTALEYLDTLAKEAAQDPQLQLELAAAYERFADVQGQANVANTGHPQQALESYAKATALYEARLAADPDDAATRVSLAMAHLKRSRLLLFITGDPRAGVAESDRAVTLLESAAAGRADDRALRGKLATAYRIHAFHLGFANHQDTAIATAAKAVATMEDLNRRYPGDHDLEFQLAGAYADSATVAQTTALNPQLIARYEKALGMQRRLLAADPEHALRYWRGILVNTFNIGRNLYAAGDYQAALSEFREADEAAMRATADKNNIQAQQDSARVAWKLGATLTALGRTDEAAAMLAGADTSLRSIAARGGTLEVEFLRAETEQAIGEIEVRRAVAAAERSAQLRHWRAAHDHLSSSVQRYQTVTRGGATLEPLDQRDIAAASAALARSDAEIARLQGGALNTPLAARSESR